MSDTIEKLVKAFPTDCTVEPGERAVTAKISTVSVDRDGDVLMPMGCDAKNYQKNPVVMLIHDYWTLPVGKCVALEKREDCIVAKTVFAARPEGHPAGDEWMPDTLLSLFQQGVLRAFSVGLNSMEHRPASPRDCERFGEDCRRVVSKWELLEYSVVPIPANQEAVAMAVSKGLDRATADKLFGTDSIPPLPAPRPAPARKVYSVPGVIVPRPLPHAEAARAAVEAISKAAGRIYIV